MERPTEPGALIVFDGVCGLCSAAVRFLLRHDRRAVFRFAPLQSEAGRAAYRAAGLEPDAAATWLVVTATGTFTRSDAVMEVARRLGGPWRLFASLKMVPRRWRDALYESVARHRYRWFGRRPQCMVPPENLKDRFPP